MEKLDVTLALEDAMHPDAVILIRRLSAELGTRYGDDGSGAFVPADVQVPRAAFVVARVAGQAVGCGAIRPFPEDEGTAEVKRMYVDPDKRGHGIGRRILAKLEDVALGFGYRRLVLETDDRQPEAIALYERAGFCRMDCYGHYAGQAQSVCFEKAII